MLPFIFGIISACSFGISNTYWKIASRNTDYLYLIFYRGVIASIIFLSTWIYLSLNTSSIESVLKTSINTMDIVNTYILCFVCAFGLVFFLKAIKYSYVSIAVAISSVNIFGILVTVFIVGETFSPIYFLSFLFSLTGVVLCQQISFKKKKFVWNKGLLYALLASFFWGITYPLFKFVSPSIGAIPLSFILESSVMIVAFILILLTKKLHLFKENSKLFCFKHYGILALLLIGGTLFYNLSIQKLSVLHLDIVSNVQFIVSISLSILFYKEKLATKQVLGLLTILLSVIITQYFI